MRHRDAPDVPVTQDALVALKIKEVQMNENKKEELIIPLYKNDMITAKENGEMADWHQL